MTNIYFDSFCSDAGRQVALHEGHIFDATAKLCTLKKQLICEVLGAHDPLTIDHRLSIKIGILRCDR